MATESEIRKALTILPPGILSAVRVDGGRVMLILEVEPSLGTKMEDLRLEAEAVVKALPGVESVQAVLTAEKKVKAAPPNKEEGRPCAPEVKHIIAVGSGKGGVGKSTTAVNLAVAAAQTGLKVGLLDADIFGPSVPVLLGQHEKPPSENGMIVPWDRHGIKFMSLGLLMPREEAVVWRGLMVQAAVRQLLADVAWGPLDVLFIDLPPGTGDAPITLIQKVKLAGAVVVTTPQDLALADVRRALTMFEKTNVPVLGMIENMSTFICPHCGEASHIFGEGAAGKLGIKLLGSVPLDIKLRETSDAGVPIVVAAPESAVAKIYKDVAGKVLARVNVSAAA